MKDLLKKLTGAKIYVISPHLDDAVLSCGALMLKLQNKSDITVVNVFTKAHRGPYTLSARKFLKASGNYKSAVDLFAARRDEDAKALSQLKIRVIDLGFQDSLFRKNGKNNLFTKLIPELGHVYPTYRWHILKGIAKSDPVAKKLKNQLIKINRKNVVVLAPYGVGNHIDHLLVRKVCGEVFGEVILYSDFPYNIYNDKKMFPFEKYDKFELKIESGKKEKIIKLYETQLASLFPNRKINKRKETFYISRNYEN